MLKNKLYTKKEISALINNAVIAQRQILDYLPSSRQSKIRSYAEALLEIPFEHLEEKLISPEELMFVFCAAALLTNKTYVDKTVSIEALASAEEILKKKRKKNGPRKA